MSGKLRDYRKPQNNSEEDTYHPNVRKLINSCKGQDLQYRILQEGTLESKENNRRLTIVINAKKELVKTYYG
jgi:hypothetical protein